MARHTFNYNGDTYIRVSRRQAKRQYMQGKAIVVCPCNLSPFSIWHPEGILDINNRHGFSEDFDAVVNSFEYYNCNHNETGRYASFYVKGA